MNKCSLRGLNFEFTERDCIEAKQVGEHFNVSFKVENAESHDTKNLLEHNLNYMIFNGKEVHVEGFEIVFYEFENNTLKFELNIHI